MSDTAEKIRALMDANGITIDAVFVPFSKSRNATPNPKTDNRSLNWHIMLRRNGRDVYTTDYSAGIGHCPSYKAGRWPARSYEMQQLITGETEQGREARWADSLYRVIFSRTPILPDAIAVLAALLRDADAIDYPTYDDYAREMAMDVDSRKGEQTYRACLTCGLTLRSAFGEALFTTLRELAREY